MYKLTITILLLLVKVQCLAGSEVGTVRFQHGQYGSSSSSAGKMFFFLDGNEKNNVSACSTASEGERWVIDNNALAANMQLSILLSASLSGKQVMVRGSNNCEVSWRY